MDRFDIISDLDDELFNKVKNLATSGQAPEYLMSLFNDYFDIIRLQDLLTWEFSIFSIIRQNSTDTKLLPPVLINWLYPFSINL